MFCTNIDRNFDDIKIFMFTIYIHIRNIKYILRGTVFGIGRILLLIAVYKIHLHLSLRTIPLTVISYHHYLAFIIGCQKSSQFRLVTECALRTSLWCCVSAPPPDLSSSAAELPLGSPSPGPSATPEAPGLAPSGPEKHFIVKLLKPTNYWE